MCGYKDSRLFYCLWQMYDGVPIPAYHAVSHVVQVHDDHICARYCHEVVGVTHVENSVCIFVVTAQNVTKKQHLCPYGSSSCIPNNCLIDVMQRSIRYMWIISTIKQHFVVDVVSPTSHLAMNDTVNFNPVFICMQSYRYAPGYPFRWILLTSPATEYRPSPITSIYAFKPVKSLDYFHCLNCWKLLSSHVT